MTVRNKQIDVKGKKKLKTFVGNVVVDSVAEGNNVKPYSIFAAMSGYIVPTKSALRGTELGNKANPAQELTFKVLSEISHSNGDYKAFDNPVDDTTGSFRKRLETALGTDYTAAKAGAHVMSAAELYETMN